ncbi:hypothetical protein Ddc_18476 [Ditylenchus destructor]|nr:hypothetical protein Ddc_18476 [Ditylenchus destructor]
MDNGTLVEAFKFLNYSQLAKNSLVSKRFSNLISTHRHSLIILRVETISMKRYSHILYNILCNNLSFSIFNKKFSTEEYNDWVMQNGYSKQVPFEDQVDRTEGTQNDCLGYWLNASAYYSKFITKFMELKNCNEYQIVRSIEHFAANGIEEVLKRDYAQFIVKEERNQVFSAFELVNNDIGKKLKFYIIHQRDPFFALEIKNL